MAILSISVRPLTSCHPSSTTIPALCCNFPYSSTFISSPKPPTYHHQQQQKQKHSSIIFYDNFRASYRFSSSSSSEEDEEEEVEEGHKHNGSFEEAVALFNGRDYYRCHDFLESLLFQSQDPLRTLFHGILQCAVGFHHLFNQNHRGAMMELGEGLCKLRKMNFDDHSGPFHQFEQQISAVLNFIYHTQLELAACADDYCLAMDQSERSYQLLGGYAAGQHLYQLQSDPDGTMYIAFCPERSYATSEPQMVKLPILLASTEHLMDFEYD